MTDLGSLNINVNDLAMQVKDGIDFKVLSEDVENDMMYMLSLWQKSLMTEHQYYLNMHQYRIYEGSDDGKWHTYLPDKSKKYGRRAIKRTTKKQLENAIVTFYKEQAENPTIEELFHEWNDGRVQTEDISEASGDRYRKVLQRHFPEFGKRKIKDVRQKDVKDFIRNQKVEHNLTAKALSSLVCVTKGILLYAKDKELIDFNVTELFNDLHLPKCRKRTVKPNDERAFGDTEFKKMLSYLIQNQDIWNLGILLLCVTGMRIGEMSALKHEDVMNNGCLFIHRTETTYKGKDGKTITYVKDSPKTDAGNRCVFIPKDYHWLLEKINGLDSEGEYVFTKDGKRMTSNCFRRRLERLEKKLGIPHKSPHKLRATYATILLNSGNDQKFIESQVGHNNISTTMNYYYVDILGAEKKLQNISGIEQFTMDFLKEKGIQTIA